MMLGKLAWMSGVCIENAGVVVTSGVLSRVKEGVSPRIWGGPEGRESRAGPEGALSSLSGGDTSRGGSFAYITGAVSLSSWYIRFERMCKQGHDVGGCL